jgi:hypothetical protein
MSISIKYGNLNSTSVSPYTVEHFNWDPKTNEVIATVTISSHYIYSDTDISVQIWLGKFELDPNTYYYMPKNRFSRHPNGGIYPDYDKYGRNIYTKPDPFQWEFDRQSYNDDLQDYETKSINTQVWTSVDSEILSISRDNERKIERGCTVTTMSDGTVWYVPNIRK